MNNNVVIPEHFYFHCNEIEQFIHVQVPVALIKEKVFRGISDSAKILYGLLLNRTGLSLRNGWRDEKGRTYIIYTIESLKEDLGIGETKAKKLFAELSNINDTGVGLIRKERIINRPSRIYVLNFVEVYNYLMGREKEELVANTSDGQAQMRLSVGRECALRSVADTSDNYNKSIDNESRDNYSNHSMDGEMKACHNLDVMEEMEITRNLIKGNIEYDILLLDSKVSQDKLDELVEIMVEACVLMGDIEISGVKIPHQLIRSRFEKYNQYTMMSVLNSLSENTTDVRNVKKYLLATLYNAPLTSGNQMGLRVQHDLYS